MLHLAALDEEGYVSIGSISEKLDISFHFLTKTFQKLTDADILTSHRGPKGGVAFRMDPEDITLKMIVVAIDGDKLFTECILGLPGCGDHKPCPLHEGWAVERSRLDYLLANTTLEEMAEGMKQEDFRLAHILPSAAED